MPKSLAKGHRKVWILTTPPANPQAPTVTELNAGISADQRIMDSDWTFGFTDSDKVNEPSLYDTNNVNVYGADNAQCAFTIFRYFDAITGVPDPVGDSLWTATKTKGATLYVYERESGKLDSAGPASSDELLGMQVLTDNPQKPSDSSGYIKRRIPTEPQVIYKNAAVA